MEISREYQNRVQSELKEVWEDWDVVRLLGMAIVHRLLDMMGSELVIKSEYGVGSEFSFVVSQEIVDGTPIGDFRQKAKEITEKKEEEKYLYAPKARILVVDDNEMNLKVIRNLLKLNGIKPELAGSGEEALAKMKDNCYDIVFLDHMMPKMDGIETLHKARQEGLLGGKTTVFALTANAVVGARETYLQEGFDDYLSKPVEIPAMENALAKYLPAEIVSYRTKSDKVQESAPEDASPAENGVKEKASDEVMELLPMEDSSNEEDDFEGIDEKDIGRIFDGLNANGIVTEEGMRFCGDDQDFYLDMLSDYVKEYDEKTKELEDSLAADDMNLYTVKVHALKSTAKTVGDRSVFEKARDLEQVAKSGDAQEVARLHPQLLEDYARKIEWIKKLIK